MSQDGTQAIRRAATILRRIAFVSGDGSATLSDISQSLGLSRSTAHRILKCLTETELASYDPKTRNYEIGMLGYELGLAVTERVLDFAPFIAAVDRVAERTNVTAYLMRRSGIEAVCIHKAEARSLIRVIPVEVGQRRFLGVGAGATALLAGLSDTSVERVLDTVEGDLAAYSDLSREAVLAAVAQARNEGFAESHGQVYPAVYGLGFALCGHASEPDLAISIAAHAPSKDEKSVEAWKTIIREEVAKLAVPVSEGARSGIG